MLLKTSLLKLLPAKRVGVGAKVDPKPGPAVDPTVDPANLLAKLEPNWEPVPVNWLVLAPKPVVDSLLTDPNAELD